MRIIFFETMPGEQERITQQLPPGNELIFLEEPLSMATLEKARGADAVSVFVKSELRRELLDQLPDLKLITTRSMGYDHIDLEYARSKNIKVNNVTTYAAHPVAEFTFALLLAVMRKIVPACNQLREGTDFEQRGLMGFNLFSKTIGVIGTGRIGRNVIGIAKGFGMNPIAYDTMSDAAFATESNFQYVSLDELLAQSDVITLHVPYMKETHHLIGAAQFTKMKKGVVIINTARGEIMDTTSLVAALRDGTVWGAGLDVLEEERELKEEGEMLTTDKNVDYRILAADHHLIDLPNVIVTPHIAFETHEAMEEINRVTAETISNFIAGKEQKYL
jgi:D-lactate dehydrogenase